MFEDLKELILMKMDHINNDIEILEEELESLRPDPNLVGIIAFKHIKCGKSSCRCMNGGPLHGPYPHLQWYESGKIKTKYLNQKLYPKVAKELKKSKRIKEINTKLEELKKKREKEQNKLLELFK